MAELALLVVGPATRATGGVARFLAEQRRRLPDEVAVEVHDNAAGLAPSGGRLGTALASLRAMAGFARRRRPDVVHVHTSHGLAFYRSSWYVFVASVLWRRPVVVHVHGSSFDTFAADTSPLAVGFQRLTFGLADRVIALSEGWRDVLADRVDDAKLVVVPNAIDPEEYRPCYGADPPVVAFVSNLIERKGVRELVAAVERLDGGDLQVRIAGDGPLAPLVADLAERSSNVDYRGYVTEAEKRRLVETASAFVLPTHAEGLPIALLEGMAGGNAVITTDVDAIPEVVDERSGWLVPPRDVDALLGALRAFAAEPGRAEAMGRHNRAIVEERFAWPVVVDRLLAVYRSVTGAADPSSPVPAPEPVTDS